MGTSASLCLWMCKDGPFLPLPPNFQLLWKISIWKWKRSFVKPWDKHNWRRFKQFLRYLVYIPPPHLHNQCKLSLHSDGKGIVWHQCPETLGKKANYPKQTVPEVWCCDSSGPRFMIPFHRKPNFICLWQRYHWSGRLQLFPNPGSELDSGCGNYYGR